MIKTDCFALHVDQCSALCGLYCELGECSFYKSRSDYEAECLRCDARNAEMGILLPDGRLCQQLQQERYAKMVRKVRKEKERK